VRGEEVVAGRPERSLPHGLHRHLDRMAWAAMARDGARRERRAREQVELGIHAELEKLAARVDRLSADPEDQELTRALAAVRNVIGGTLALLAARHGMPVKPRRWSSA
jgi:hypothetical protein